MLIRQLGVFRCVQSLSDNEVLVAVATKFQELSQSDTTDQLMQRCSQLEEDLRKMAVTADRYRRKAKLRAQRIRELKVRRYRKGTSVGISFNAHL